MSDKYEIIFQDPDYESYITLVGLLFEQALDEPKVAQLPRIDQLYERQENESRQGIGGLLAPPNTTGNVGNGKQQLKEPNPTSRR